MAGEKTFTTFQDAVEEENIDTDADETAADESVRDSTGAQTTPVVGESDDSAGSSEATPAIDAAEGEEATETDSSGDGADREGAEEAKEDSAEEDQDAAKAELTDETDVALGEGESAPLGRLKEAYKLVRKAQAAVEAVNQRTEEINAFGQGFRKALIDNTGPTLLHAFTQANQGDGRKAFEQLARVADQIVAEYIKFEELPESAKDAVFIKQENQTLKQKIEAAENAKKQNEQQAADAARAKEIHTEITEALAAAGLEVTPKAIAGIAQRRLQNEALSTAAAVTEYKAEVDTARAEWLKTLDVDALPDDVKRKLAQQRIKDTKAKKLVAGTGPQQKPKKRGPVVLRMSEFQEFLERDE